MDEVVLGNKIATQVVADTRFWIALVGLVGAIVGAFITLVGNLFLHWLKENPKKNLDKKRRKILEEMLDDSRFTERWRKLNTLSAVIGANEEETKRLLFEIGARGSENADGKWGLIKNHPFPGPN